jgi:hypothetical protein
MSAAQKYKQFLEFNNYDFSIFFGCNRVNILHFGMVRDKRPKLSESTSKQVLKLKLLENLHKTNRAQKLLR